MYHKLFQIIEDKAARNDEIDDAIIKLADYPNAEVIEFLIEVSYQGPEDYILSSIGETMAEIFLKEKGLLNQYREQINSLPKIVLKEINVFLN